MHFGKADFLARYERFEKNVADWKAAHPNLAAVDMRYDREAVLEMKPGTAAVTAEAGEEGTKPAVVAGKPKATAGKALAKPISKAAARPAPKPLPKFAGHAAVIKPAGGHLQTAFAVHGGTDAGTTAGKRPTTQAVPQ